MKQFLTFLLLLLAAGVSFEGLAADTFDVTSVYGLDASAIQEEAETADVTPGQADPIRLFARTLKDMAAASLMNDIGFQQVHGQPLPGVLITLLLGAAFGLARRKRHVRNPDQDEQNAAAATLLTARLFRMNILFLNPPRTIHAISPGPDLFCLRE